MIDFVQIKQKHKNIIDIAKQAMTTMKDYEHNYKHMEDVVKNCEEILIRLDDKILM